MIGAKSMHKKLLLIVLFLLQFAWSIQITGSKESGTAWNLRFSHIPATDNVGAFKTKIQFSSDVDISSIISDAPNGGAWSQVKPVLSRNGNLLEVLCVGPAMINSRIADTLEMFHISFEISGKSGSDSLFNGIIDSLWFDECLDTRGSEMAPFIDLKTSTLKPGKTIDRSKSVEYRDFGRIHSLTFNLAGPEMVKARVVDIRGRVLTKLTEKKLTPGMHTLRWPENARQIAAGTYFIQLEINNFTYNKKVNYYK